VESKFSLIIHYTIFRKVFNEADGQYYLEHEDEDGNVYLVDPND